MTTAWALVNVFAILVSPVIAVAVGTWLSSQREARMAKRDLFWRIFGNRHLPTSLEVVHALNLIDVVFHDDVEVRRLWSELYEMYGNEGLQNPNGFEAWNRKSRELYVAMAKASGHKANISTMDGERVYSPKGLNNQFEKMDALSDAVTLILRRGQLEPEGAASTAQQGSDSKQGAVQKEAISQPTVKKLEFPDWKS